MGNELASDPTTRLAVIDTDSGFVTVLAKRAFRSLQFFPLGGCRLALFEWPPGVAAAIEDAFAGNGNVLQVIA